MVSAIIVILVVHILNRFLHFDGLIDLGDGLVATGTPEKKLAAMKDTRVGAGGVSYGILFSLLIIASLASLPSYLFFIPVAMEVLAKNSLLTVAAFGKEREGLGSPFVKSTEPSSAVASALLSFALLLPFALVTVNLGSIDGAKLLVVIIAMLMASVARGLAHVKGGPSQLRLRQRRCDGRHQRAGQGCGPADRAGGAGLDLVDALVTAGGKGTRMRDVEGEKPLQPILGRPMIDWVLDALRSSERTGRICVSVSDNAPRTREYLAQKGIRVVETSGTGYVPDLNQALGHLQAHDVLICPADMPLITGQGIDAVLSSYRNYDAASLSVAVPSSIVRSLGAVPSFTLEVEGREVVLCGVSVVDREQMLTEKMLSQGYMITENEQFALNVNAREDLKRAEQILSRRSML